MGAGESISGNITGLQVVLTGVSLSAACGGTNTISGCPVLEQRHQLDDGRGGDGEPDDDDREQLHLRNDVGDELLDRPHDLDRLGDQRRELPGRLTGGEELRHGRDLHPRRSRAGPGQLHDQHPDVGHDDDVHHEPGPDAARDQRSSDRHLAGLPGLLGRGHHQGRGARQRRPLQPGATTAIRPPNAEYDPNGYDYTVEVGLQRPDLDLRPHLLRDRLQHVRRLLRHRRPLDRRGRHPGHDRLHPLRHQQHAARPHRRRPGGHVRRHVRQRDPGRLQRQLRPAGGLERRRQRARTRTAAATRTTTSGGRWRPASRRAPTA